MAITATKLIRQLSVSERTFNLITATIAYRGKETPKAPHVDAHLQTGNALMDSWILVGTVYERSGEGFKDRVCSDGLVFMVPQKFHGLKDTLLVFQNGFEIDLKTRLFSGEVTHVVEDFPPSSGWYATHAETGMPQGKLIPSTDSRARYSYRRDSVNGKYIGAPVRGCGFIHYPQSIILGYGPSGNLRVAQFAEERAQSEFHKEFLHLLLRALQ